MKVSVVVPCFNEADVIDTTIERICRAMELPSRFSTEILIVDDGSEDDSAWIAGAAVLPPGFDLRVIRLSRNFGHQAAVSAGIAESTGDLVAIIDADLQDPPELIPEMIQKMLEEGHDVVYGRRISRKGTTLWKRLSYHLFYRLLSSLVSDIEIPSQVGDFRVISRRVANVLLSMPETGRFLRGMIPYIGFSQAAFDYERDARHSGRPKYTLVKLIRLALDGLVSFSTRPLRVALYLGLIMFLLSMLGIIVVLAIRLGSDEWIPGWASTSIVLLGFGGLQFLFLGLLGEYVGRIFEEVKARPNFIIREENRAGPSK